MIKIKRNKKRPLRRIGVKKELRVGIITILIIIILASFYTTFTAIETPNTIEQVTSVYSYSHTGSFDYDVHLLKNSLYTIDILHSGQGPFFKKIIDNISASFTYNFKGTKQAEIQGSYKITAQVQTNHWSKNYEIKPSTSFNSDTGQVQFSTEFPIDLTLYEDYISQISEEIGSAAQNSKLDISCLVAITAKTVDGTINEKLSSSIQIPLSQNIVEIGENLTTTQIGSIDKLEKVYVSDKESKQDTLTKSSVFLSIILIGFVGITKNRPESTDKISKKLKKINKKYGEWIVKTSEPSLFGNLKTIKVDSLDDLVKVSEEIGKPLIHFSPNIIDEAHIFAVLDDSIQYKFVLDVNESKEDN